MFENRVPRKMFGPMRDGTIGSWRKLHKEGFRKFYPSSNSTCRIIKSRKMRWTGHVAFMGKRRVSRVFWWESQTEETTKKTLT
jgi:hypothetical protein